MKSPLVVNIRCTCIEEYINIQKLHKEYIRQSKEGEITSFYVGAEFAVPGEFEAVDALIAKRGPRQMPYCVNFGGKKIEVADIRDITKKFTKEDFEELKKEVEKGAVITSGPVSDEAKELPQAVDGGVDALGNPPLPEKPLTVDEMKAIGAGYAEQEEKSSISEFAIGDRAEEFHYEDEAKPDFGPATEPTHFAEEPVKAKPEITLTDVLTAMAEEPDPMEAIKTEAEGEPDGDGQDYNTTYAG